MKLKLIQHRETCIDSVYIFKDFLEDLEYLKYVKEKIKKCTEIDKMNHYTNVQANMTEYNELLKNEDLIFLQKKILDHVAMVYTLRTPHPHQEFKLSLTDCWGMKHTKGQFTKQHSHSGAAWSGSFYIDVPSPVEIFFSDFMQSLKLESNMLVFFTGHIKHLVNASEDESNRLSIGFNLEQKILI